MKRQRSIVDGSEVAPGVRASSPVVRAVRFGVGTLILGLAVFLSLAVIRSVVLALWRDGPVARVESCDGVVEALRADLAQRVSEELVRGVPVEDVPLRDWRAHEEEWEARWRAAHNGCPQLRRRLESLHELEHALETQVYRFHNEHGELLLRLEESE